MENRQYINGIEGLRAFAALLVLIFHYYVFAGKPNFLGSFIANAGWVGVDIFFTISGFVLFLPWGYAYLKGEQLSLKQYYKRRILRIVPAYYFNIIIIVTLMTPAFILQWDKFTLVLATLGFLQGFIEGEQIPMVNGVMWSLCLEMQFYLLLPFIYKFFVGKRWIWGLLGSISIAILYKTFMLYIFNPGWDRVYNEMFWLNRQLPGVIQQFGIGMALASFWINIRDKKIVNLSMIFTLAGLAGVILLLLLMNFSVKYGGSNYWFGTGNLGYFPVLTLNTLLSFATALIILSICCSKSIISKMMSNKILVYLGTISYGIYLWHYVIGRIYVRDLQFHSDSNKFIILVVICGALTLLISVISYHFVEKPFLKKRNYKTTSNTNNAIIEQNI